MPKRARDASGRFIKGFNDGLQGNPINVQSPLDRAFNSAKSIMRSQGAGMADIFKGIFQGIGQQITGIISGAVSAGIGALKDLATKVIDIGSTAENLKIAFTTIIGDGQKANKLLADMRQFAAQTPFTGTQVQSAAQSLLTVVKPEEMISALRRLGEVASGTRS
ncbi:MAG: hypothetical protein V7K88_03035 [Nostoc sp.]|uniref:hypothetical protein n=1 Tax=Nostoc sp. TaxID=1180 RepID=UPI002FFCA909